MLTLPLTSCFLWVLLVLTFFRHHDNSSQGEGQEGVLEMIEKLAEFVLFSDNMSVDSGHRLHASREEEEIPAIPRSRFRIRILTMVEQIVYKNDYERHALELLKRQTYAHVKRFKTRFLITMGLLQDMNQAFTAVGWENFTDIIEPGSHLLTMEFLMSLTVEETSTETKVYFQFFNEQFEMTLQQFSVALDFNKRCILDPNTLAERY